MIMLSRLSAALVLTLSFAVHAAPLQRNHLPYYGQNFYSATGQSDLKASLFTIMTYQHFAQKGQYDEIAASCPGTSCYTHSPITYDQARKYLFTQLQNKNGAVVDVYCHKRLTNIPSDARVSDKVMNIEHSWPQSKFNSAFYEQTQKTDLHHLFVADSRANGQRGNNPFAEISNGDTLDNGCSDSVMGDADRIPGSTNYATIYFEPPNDHKGHLARAIFYFSIRYKLPIDPVQEYYLRKWHRDYPVDADEKARHEQIFAIEKIRNPFIDFPSLVDKIRDF